MTTSARVSTGVKASPGASPGRQATTLALTAVAFFMVVLDALVVVTALPSIHRSAAASARCSGRSGAHAGHACPAQGCE